MPQPDGSLLALTNAAWIWVPLLAVATLAAWFGMNDIGSSKASVASQLPVLKRLHLWLLSLLYLATFGSFIGFSAGFAMLDQNAISRRKHSATGVLWPLYRRAGAIGRRRDLR